MVAKIIFFERSEKMPIRRTVQKIIGEKLVTDRQTDDRQTDRQTDIFELTPIHMGKL